MKNISLQMALELLNSKKNENFFEYLAQEVRRIPWVAERYAQESKCTRFESLAMKICLSMLERFSKKDVGGVQ